MDANSAPFAMITKPDLLGGVRIEYVDTGDQPPLEEWGSHWQVSWGIGATQRRTA